MSRDIYGENLKRVVGLLEASGVASHIRGEGTARFVYSSIQDRATEISCAVDEGVFIEYWHGTDLTGSVKEEVVKVFWYCGSSMSKNGVYVGHNKQSSR